MLGNIRLNITNSFIPDFGLVRLAWTSSVLKHDIIFKKGRVLNLSVQCARSTQFTTHMCVCLATPFRCKVIYCVSVCVYFGSSPVIGWRVLYHVTHKQLSLTVQRDNIQTRTFTRWANVQLKEKGVSVGLGVGGKCWLLLGFTFWMTCLMSSIWR